MKVDTHTALQEEISIVSSCMIGNFAVLKDGISVYESNVTVLSVFLNDLYQELGIKYPKFYKMDNLSKLGFLACEKLLMDGTISKEYLPEEVGVILSNANSSLDADLKYYETVKDIASPALFVYTLPNIVIGEICIRNKIKGENTFFISPEFDPEMMLSYITDLFKKNIMTAFEKGSFSKEQSARFQRTF